MSARVPPRSLSPEGKLLAVLLSTRGTVPDHQLSPEQPRAPAKLICSLPSEVDLVCWTADSGHLAPQSRLLQRKLAVR